MSNKIVAIYVRIPKDRHTELGHVAGRLGVSQSTIVRWALAEYLDKAKEEAAK